MLGFAFVFFLNVRIEVCKLVIASNNDQFSGFVGRSFTVCLTLKIYTGRCVCVCVLTTLHCFVTVKLLKSVFN